MRKMRKWVSLLCAVVMVFTLAAPAFASVVAASNEFPENSYLGEIDGGNIFTLMDDCKAVTILTNDEEHLISISIKYSNQGDTIHEWHFDQYPVSDFQPESLHFWTDIIDYAESHMDVATAVTITSVIFEEGVDVPQFYNSARADLLEAIKDCEGSSEYDNLLRYYGVYEGQTCRVYESLKFEIALGGLKSWEKAIAVASLITTILGAIPVSATIRAICFVFGVAVSAATILDPGALNEYLVTARYCRYTTINNSAYVYNSTYMYNSYRGYENAHDNSRAYLGGGELTYDAPLGATYYNNYLSQVADAYNVFKILGQRP